MVLVLLLDIVVGVSIAGRWTKIDDVDVDDGDHNHTVQGRKREEGYDVPPPPRWTLLLPTANLCQCRCVDYLCDSCLSRASINLGKSSKKFLCHEPCFALRVHTD